MAKLDSAKAKFEEISKIKSKLVMENTEVGYKINLLYGDLSTSWMECNGSFYIKKTRCCFIFHVQRLLSVKRK